MTDVFKAKPKAFIEAIYGNALGQIRSEQLIADLVKVIQEHSNINHIVDIGAGHAPVTLSLLARFSDLKATLVEPSENLIGLAKDTMKHLGVDESRVAYLRCSLEEYKPSMKADLIICHAVINWTPEPKTFLKRLLDLCDQGTYVSLVFGSSTAKALRFAAQGNIGDLKNSVLTPGAPVHSLIGKEQVRPLDPDEVASWIGAAGFWIVDRAGIRVFADYVSPQILQSERALEQIKQIEQKARKSQTYWKPG